MGTDGRVGRSRSGSSIGAASTHTTSLPWTNSTGKIRPRYYAALQQVREHGDDLSGWHREYTAEGLRQTLERTWQRVERLQSTTGSTRLVLRPKQEQLLQLLRVHGSLSPRELWEAIGISKQGAMDLLRPLMEAGLVITDRIAQDGSLHVEIGERRSPGPRRLVHGAGPRASRTRLVPHSLDFARFEDVPLRGYLLSIGSEHVAARSLPGLRPIRARCCRRRRLLCSTVRDHPQFHFPSPRPAIPFPSPRQIGSRVAAPRSPLAGTDLAC